MSAPTPEEIVAAQKNTGPLTPTEAAYCRAVTDMMRLERDCGPEVAERVRADMMRLTRAIVAALPPNPGRDQALAVFDGMIPEEPGVRCLALGGEAGGAVYAVVERGPADTVRMRADPVTGATVVEASDAAVARWRGDPVKDKPTT